MCQLYRIWTIAVLTGLASCQVQAFEHLFSIPQQPYEMLLTQYSFADGEATLVKEFNLAAVHQLYQRIDRLETSLGRIRARLSESDTPAHHFQYQLLSGFVLYYRGHYADAEVSFSKAQSFLAQAGEELPIVHEFRLHLWQAITAAYLQRYDEAVSLLSSVHTAAAQKEMTNISAYAVFLQAMVNYELKNYPQARQYYHDAKLAFGEAAQVMRSEAQMGEAQMINVVGDHNKAISMLNKTLEKFERLQHRVALADGYLLKSYFLSKQELTTQALEWIAQAVSEREQLGDPKLIANAYVHYSSLLGENEQLEKGLEYAKKAIDLLDHNQDLAGKWDASVNYAYLLADAGQYQQAYTYMSQAERALLKKANLDITSITARLNSEFNLSKEQLKSQVLDEKNRSLQAQLAIKERLQIRQRWTVGLLSAASVIFSILLAIIYFLYRKNLALACQDSLTGLFNRRRILELGEQMFTTSERYRSELCVMMMDVDKFKTFNDLYGHDVGDKVLRLVAEVCEDTLRESDLIGRVGGEEFLFVLPHTNEFQGMELSRRLCNAVEKASQDQYPDLDTITVSIGLAAMDEQIKSFIELSNQADMALYQAKNAGRNQVQAWGKFHQDSATSDGAVVQ